VVFALLGALIFALLVAPVLCNFLYSRGIKEWRNPVLEWLNCSYVRSLDWCFDHLRFTRAMGLLALGLMLFLALSGIIGSEFLPHLDEGAIWIRGTFAPSTGPSSSIEMSKRARLVLADFPEVAQVVSQVGRPDDGSDASGFYNTEFFVDLRPRELWRLQFHSRKDELIAAMDQKLSQFPGVGWNFSQPISDNVEEAVSGVKGELAVKLSGTDLKTLEEKAEQIQGVPRYIPGPRPAQHQSQRRSCCRRPLRHKRQRCSGRHRDRGRRQSRKSNPYRRTALRHDCSLRAQLPPYGRRHFQHSPPRSVTRESLLGSTLQNHSGRWRLHHLSRR
jgi:heavy metal efflux system protein